MLKFFVTSFDKDGSFNCNLRNGIFNPLIKINGNCFQKVHKVQDANVIFIEHTYTGNFKFNHKLGQVVTKLNLPIVIFDFLENTVTTFPSIFLGIRGLDKYANPNYKDLFKFTKSQIKNVKLYFKRELLLSEDVTKLPFVVKPIEYITSLIRKYPTHTEEEFNQRIIDIFMIWGSSNWSRPLLHGELIKYAAIHGRQRLICDFGDTFRDRRPNKIVLLHVPHFRRIPITKILDAQNQAKISIAMNGCGQKCFRHTEAPRNAVMAMQDTNLVWAYPWIDGKNCIVLPVTGKKRIIDASASAQKLAKFLKSPKLYSIYLKGLKNASNYGVSNYVPNYLAKEILKVLKQDKR